MALIANDRHDLNVLYNGNYDAVMHRAGTESNEAIHEIDGNLGSHGLDMAEDMNVIHFIALSEHSKPEYCKLEDI